jgi:hypothetical protein
LDSFCKNFCIDRGIKMSAASTREKKTAMLTPSVPLPTFLPRRYRPGSLANWSGHLAFANDLVGEFRPSLLVELGTHYGESYFGFCQSVLKNGVDCLCYAVDHWHGEEHSGFYGEEVYDEVSSYNAKFYKDFSYLLRSSFDDAVLQFGENSIDLLHIDGPHTYEAGSHDFRTWFPKVREGGIILLHDVFVRHANFGIWRLWQELEAEFPDTFAFHHDWGLGVLRKSGQGIRRSALLEALFDSSPDSQEYVRRYYVLYAAYVERALGSASEPGPVSRPGLKAQIDESGESKTFLQVFPFDGQGYSEGASLQQELEIGEWNTVVFELADGLFGGPLRLDPADRPCVIEIGSIQLTDSNSGKSIWCAQDPGELKSIHPAHSALFLPHSDACLILSYGTDPQLQLPLLYHSGSVRLEVRVRIDPGLDRLAAALQEHQPDPARLGEAGPAVGAVVQVYPFNVSGYVEHESITRKIGLGSWTTLTFDLPPGAFRGPVRLDPTDQPGIVEVGEIKVSDAQTGTVVACIREAAALRQLPLADSLLSLPSKEKCLFLSYGTDPQMQLSLPADVPGPCRLDISLRIEAEPWAVVKTVAAQLQGEHGLRETKMAEEIQLLKAELKAAQSERLALAAEVSQLATDKRKAIREKEEAIESARRLAGQDESERLALPSESREDVLRRQSDLESELEKQRAIVRGVERSASWRVTAPIRKTVELLRKMRNGGSSGAHA